LGDYDADREQRVAFHTDLFQQVAVPTRMMIAVEKVTRGFKRFARPIPVGASLNEGDTLAWGPQLAGPTYTWSRCRSHLPV
jgi:hypothetical protein